LKPLLAATNQKRVGANSPIFRRVARGAWRVARGARKQMEIALALFRIDGTRRIKLRLRCLSHTLRSAVLDPALARKLGGFDRHFASGFANTCSVARAEWRRTC
jgi:hypothetical protein